MPPTHELSSGHVRRSGSSGHFPRFAATFSGSSGGSGGHPKFSDLVKQVKRSRKQLNNSTRKQFFFTLSATLLILAGFIAVGVTYAVTFVTTSDALLEAGFEFRRLVARAVSDEISLLLKPVHAASTRLSLRNSMDPGTAQVIWPLTPEVIEDDFDELLANMWVHLTGDLHLRKVNANGTGKVFVPFLGIAVNIAVEEDLRTPSTDLHGCSAVLQTGVFLAEHDGSGSGQINVDDGRRKSAYRSVFYTYEDGRRETKIRWSPYQTDIVSPLDFTLAELVAPTCSSLPQMQVVAGGTGAADFNWYGPVGTFRGIEGMATIRNAKGQPIGYITSGFSVIFSINTILNNIIEDGGVTTRGATLAIISETGVLLGTSGPGAENAWTVQYNYVAEVPEGSALGQAFSLLRRAAGNPCPARHESRDEGDRLTDAIPIYAEDYGLPPLTERWCVIQTYPRKNLYAEIDAAKQTRIISGGALAGLFFCATMLFLASLWAAVKSDRALRDERLKMDAHRVISAVKDVDTLNCPMALVSAADFLQLPELQAHEDMRDRDALTILDSLEEIETFRASNEIIFFSHQWLAKKFPDKGGAQLDAMKGAIRAVQTNPTMVDDDADVEKGVHIWCDYPSIAQRHTKMQKAAVSSLPLYARVADKFIIIAPPVIHADTLLLCDLHSYTGRGWCRAEMLAKACGSGIQDMYTCLDTSGTLSPVTPRDLSRLSLNIFQAEFTVRADMEDLVDPVLGLYSLVLRGRDLPHMQRIYAHITEDKSNFFPESYNNGREEVKLFGKYIELLEMYITRGHTAMMRRPSPGQLPPSILPCGRLTNSAS